MSEIKINANFSFGANLKNLSIKEINLALTKYAKDFNSVKELNDKYLLFLDTNILLDYYGMSQKEKKNLKDFLVKHKDRILITKQSEQEFIRNRVSVIEDFFSSINDVKNNYQKDLLEDAKNKFKNTIESKILKYDYPELWSELNNIFSLFETKLFNNYSLRDKINDKLDRIKEDNKFLKITDDILDLYQEFSITKELDVEEIEFLKTQYEQLKQKYNNTKENIRWKVAFPGCGEKKRKEEPYGDFIIYHEMIKHMKEQNSDALFITNDITKNDWLQKKLEPFIHYIEKTHCLTGFNLFILSGKDIIPEVSFEQIYITKNARSDFEARFNSALNSVYLHISSLEKYKNSEIESEIILRKGDFRTELDLKITNEDGTVEGVEVYYIHTPHSSVKDGLYKRIRMGDVFLSRKYVDTYSIYIVLGQQEKIDKIEHRVSKHLKSEVDDVRNPISVHFGYLDNSKRFVSYSKLR